MSFFPITERARGPPPPSRSPAATTAPTTPSAAAAEARSPPSHNNADLLGIDFDGDGEGDAAAAAAVAGVSGGGGVVSGGSLGPATAAATKGVGEGVVFEGLALPGVVHEETRTVDTENASVEASIKVLTQYNRGAVNYLPS